MERTYNHHMASSLKNGDQKHQHDHTAESHLEEDHMSPSFNLRNISKLILPPLGASSYNQNPVDSKGWIISPMDSKYRWWQSFMVLLVGYSAWVYPFEVAFLHSSLNREVYIVDNVVDIFFAVDIVLTFFVAFIDPRTQLLVRDSKNIATRRL